MHHDAHSPPLSHPSRSAVVPAGDASPTRVAAAGMTTTLTTPRAQGHASMHSPVAYKFLSPGWCDPISPGSHMGAADTLGGVLSPSSSVGSARQVPSMGPPLVLSRSGAAHGRMPSCQWTPPRPRLHAYAAPPPPPPPPQHSQEEEDVCVCADAGSPVPGAAGVVRTTSPHTPRGQRVASAGMPEIGASPTVCVDEAPGALALGSPTLRPPPAWSPPAWHRREAGPLVRHAVPASASPSPGVFVLSPTRWGLVRGDGDNDTTRLAAVAPQLSSPYSWTPPNHTRLTNRRAAGEPPAVRTEMRTPTAPATVDDDDDDEFAMAVDDDGSILSNKEVRQQQQQQRLHYASPPRVHTMPPMAPPPPPYPQWGRQLPVALDTAHVPVTSPSPVLMSSPSVPFVIPTAVARPLFKVSGGDVDEESLVDQVVAPRLDESARSTSASSSPLWCRARGDRTATAAAPACAESVEAAQWLTALLLFRDRENEKPARQVVPSLTALSATLARTQGEARDVGAAGAAPSTPQRPRTIAPPPPPPLLLSSRAGLPQASVVEQIVFQCVSQRCATRNRRVAAVTDSTAFTHPLLHVR